MDLDTMTVRRTGRLHFTITQADTEAISATFIMQADSVVVTKTETYADGVATFTIESPDTDVIGNYQYQVNENFATGSPDIYPNTDDCGDADCELPTVDICESLPITGS